MSETFENFTLSFLRRIAKGRPVKYNDALKSFIIQMNNWFVRTVAIQDLMEEWQAGI